jgi:hypothetical protein
VDVLVQYVVLRRNLADAWPTGSVVAQGCHAAVAVVWEHRDHPDTAAYFAPDNLDRMHKACSRRNGGCRPAPRARDAREEATPAGFELQDADM